MPFASTEIVESSNEHNGRALEDYMGKAFTRVVTGFFASAIALSVSLPALAAAEVKVDWKAQVAQAKAAAGKGENEKAQTEFKAALQDAEKAGNDQAVAEICNELANFYMNKGDVMTAASYAKRAKDVALKILMADPKTAPLGLQLAKNEENGSVWINHMMKGEFACDAKDYKTAQVEYKAAVEKAREYAGDGMPMAAALNGLGKAYVANGDYKDAEPVLLQAIALCEKNWTPVTKATALDAADAMDKLAVVFEKTGRAEDAKKMNERSKQTRESKTLTRPEGAKPST